LFFLALSAGLTLGILADRFDRTSALTSTALRLALVFLVMLSMLEGRVSSLRLLQCWSGPLSVKRFLLRPVKAHIRGEGPLGRGRYHQHRTRLFSLRAASRHLSKTSRSEAPSTPSCAPMATIRVRGFRRKMPPSRPASPAGRRWPKE
jgi:hypothetical protein